jgi:hypothetical protein
VRRWTTVKGKGKKKKELDHELHVNPVTVGVAALVAAGAAATVAVGLWLTQQKVGKTDQVATKTRYARLYEAVYEPVYETKVDSPAWDEDVTVNDQWVPPYDVTTKIGQECVGDGDQFIFSAANPAGGTGHSHWAYTHHLHGGFIDVNGTTTFGGYWTTKVTVVHHAAITHQEQVGTKLVKAARLVVYTDRMIPIRTVAEATNYDGVISKHEAAQGWVTVGEFGTVFTTGEDRLGKYVEVKVSLKNDSKFKYGISPRAGLLEGGL